MAIAGTAKHVRNEMSCTSKLVVNLAQLLTVSRSLRINNNQQPPTTKQQATNNHQATTQRRQERDPSPVPLGAEGSFFFAGADDTLLPVAGRLGRVESFFKASTMSWWISGCSSVVALCSSGIHLTRWYGNGSKTGWMRSGSKTYHMGCENNPV